MGKYFGTDGYRGRAGESLSADMAYRLGRILGGLYKREKEKCRAVIGKDTRLSSYMLEYAMASGLAASGADVYMLHVCTTPTVAYVTRSEGFDIGVMISASHNPFYDNGIKLISPSGEKIDDGLIEELEQLMDSPALPKPGSGPDIGRIVDHSAGRNRYMGYLLSNSTHSFKGKRIILDCANGGGWMIAPAVFNALGAKIITIGTEPDGVNINNGVGSTHIDSLRERVLKEGYDIGLALDGDGDRCIAVDEMGREVNGDKIMYILAKRLKREGRLSGNKVITTVMSNLGLYRALRREKIDFESTQVGDRYVYERMREGGFSLGGEQSGHIILSQYSTTGDGILTGIKLIETLIEEKASLCEAADEVAMLPQVTLSLPVKDKGIIRSERVLEEKARRESDLNEEGRIILRESGTEEVVRIMVEAESEKQANEVAERLRSVIESEEKNATKK